MGYEIKLGDKCKDRISGYTGVVTSITTYLYGCARIGITPDETDKDGKLKDTLVFDQPQLTLIESAAIEPEEDMRETNTARTGGPRFDPPSRSDVTR